MERLHSQLALAAFLQELGEAVEEAELVRYIIENSANVKCQNRARVVMIEH